MSDKAAKKKQYILDTAKKIFSEKGFKNVTMKDIVEACDISRGGLYIYFDSTETIFAEIIKQEVLGKTDIEGNAKEGSTTGDVLAMFLNEQKKVILNAKSDLSVALYEYMFQKYSEGEPCKEYKDEFSALADSLANIIDEGVSADELYAEDAKEAAKNILFALEGLKVASKTIGVTEQDIDNELLYLLGGLVVEE